MYGSYDISHNRKNNNNINNNLNTDNNNNNNSNNDKANEYGNFNTETTVASFLSKKNSLPINLENTSHERKFISKKFKKSGSP